MMDEQKKPYTSPELKGPFGTATEAAEALKNTPEERLRAHTDRLAARLRAWYADRTYEAINPSVHWTVAGLVIDYVHEEILKPMLHAMRRDEMARDDRLLDAMDLRSVRPARVPHTTRSNSQGEAFKSRVEDVEDAVDDVTHQEAIRAVHKGNQLVQWYNIIANKKVPQNHWTRPWDVVGLWVLRRMLDIKNIGVMEGMKKAEHQAAERIRWLEEECSRLRRNMFQESLDECAHEEDQDTQTEPVLWEQWASGMHRTLVPGGYIYQVDWQYDHNELQSTFGCGHVFVPHSDGHEEKR